MKTLNKNDIEKAIENIDLKDNEYKDWEIDEMILKYYQIPLAFSLDEVIENELNIIYVYNLIDELLKDRGYEQQDNNVYKKIG